MDVRDSLTPSARRLRTMCTVNAHATCRAGIAALSALVMVTPLGVVPAAAASAPYSGIETLPAALQGTWFPDDGDGRRACALHRQARSAPTDDAWHVLVGAIVIAPQGAHHVSDYGEGNFHGVMQVRASAPGVWRLRSRLGIDGYPMPGDEVVESQLQLEARRLHWQDAGEPVDSARGPFFRCTTTLPPGYEDWAASPRQARTPAASNGQSSSRPVASSRSTGTRMP